MFLERKLVKILWEENKKGIPWNRQSFVEFVAKEICPCCCCCCFYKKQQFNIIIDFILRDCIKYSYIDYDEKMAEEKEYIDPNKKHDENIVVTANGRDFIKLLGFFEEFLKRRKRTVVGVIGASLVFGLSLLAQFLVANFL